MITLTRRYRFPASHRLHSPELGDARNAELYGKCNNPYGHGHDYVLEISVGGEIDPATGLLLRVSQLDRLVEEKVLRLFSHRFINKDVPEFHTLAPTTENVALYIANVLEQNLDAYIHGRGTWLSRVHLRETDRNGFEVRLGAAGRRRIRNAHRETVLAGNY
ncbi:MAG TPA: 6-carboxytetrahydropterin synthase [Bryobacteraceae bacterium]|nr:6-carboxytetrahydropterin synthase [Bryobacteraceae bacterium]